MAASLSLPLVGVGALAAPAAPPAPGSGPEMPQSAPAADAPQPLPLIEAESAEPPVRERFLLVSADRQSVDRKSGKLIAEGNVRARFDGWLLLADRVEVLEPTRTVFASGRIRLFRGDQKLQASRLRYSEPEGSGELEDVYGVLDQELLERELAAWGLREGPESPEGNQGETSSDTDTGGGEDLDFACPPLVSDPLRPRARALLPPRRVALPALPAPAGCPGADPASRPRSLQERLTDVALGAAPDTESQGGAGASGQPPSPQEDVLAEAVPQRVREVRFRQSLDTTIRFDLIEVDELRGEADDPGDPRGTPTGPSVLRPPRPPQGRLNRLRFQASSVLVNGNRWTAREIAFTNDPFTPARSWLIGLGVEAVLAPEGVTRISARRTHILLNNRLMLPGIRNTTVGEEGLQLVLDADRRDRDGLYLGYNLPSLRVGERGRLDLQPQFNLQRAIEGSTDSYTRPGGNLAGPRVNQDIRPGDVFGLLAALDLPLNRFRLRALADLSTLNPDNFRAGTRGRAALDTPLTLPGHDTARAGAFASYRERVFNGSLGRQTVITSYGAELGGSVSFNRQAGDPVDRERPTPYLDPVRLDWSVVSGSYRAELFDTDNLDTQWRTRLQGTLSSSLQLWEAPPDPERRDLPALRYSPEPVRPGLALDFGMVGTGAFYQDGKRQSTLTLYGGPALTLGRFKEPWFDFTELNVLVGGTLRDGLSPFNFDRAVDLRTLSFRVAQQLYGPLVLEGGATVNIDEGSGFAGDLSYSYVELKLLQRSYELGLFYSPYEGTAGIRVRLNDFSFGGSGTPFVPRPAPGGVRPLSGTR